MPATISIAGRVTLYLDGPLTVRGGSSLNASGDAGSLWIVSADAQRDIQAAAARTGFRPDAFTPFLERLPRVLDQNERISYDGLVTHGFESILARLVVRRDGRYQTVTYLYPRQTVDLDAVRLDLLGVVHEAFQPTRVSIWLGTGTGAGPERPGASSDRSSQRV